MRLFCRISLSELLFFIFETLVASRQASCSSYNPNILKLQTNECKQGAARVRRVLKCCPCTKNTSIVRPSNCYTLKMVTGPFKHTAPVQHIQGETRPGAFSSASQIKLIFMSAEKRFRIQDAIV